MRTCEMLKILFLVFLQDGKHLQTVDLRTALEGERMGRLVNMCLYDNNLVMHHYVQGKHKISFFKVK